jgi:ATP adenylyltransferase
MPKRAGLARLWSPWRIGYVGHKTEPKGCIFCRAASARTDGPGLVVARRPNALVMLNRFPYNPAHVMVATTRHVGSFDRLKPEERADLFELLGLVERALTDEYRPHGFNMGANLGRVAGAGFPGHLHLHLVPRWDGDTNFMPVIGETKVLPESLDATWRRLRARLGTDAAVGAPRARSRRRG